MITWPVGVSWGSTTTLNDVVPMNVRSRSASSLNRQQVAAGIDVVRAVDTGSRSRRRPARSGSRRPGVPVSPFAGGGDDDRLVGVVVPGEDGDAADIDARGRAEVGERDVGRAARVGRQEVGRLPDAAAGTGDVHGVARGVGGIDQRSRPTRPRAGRRDVRPIDADRPPSRPGSTARRSGPA